MDSAERAKTFFLMTQLGAVAILGFIAYHFLYRDRQESGFKLTEAERLKAELGKKRRLLPGQDPLANASMKKPDPLRLSGIVLEGRAHEILGVSALATPAEIQKAYREKMKQYHPDLVGRPGTREWTDAQKIAEAINRAKDEMLQGAKDRQGRS